MNGPFLIAIGGQEYKARLERWGYTHRIAVLVGETTVTFEPDEEGGYRALGDGHIPANILQAVAEKLKMIMA